MKWINWKNIIALSVFVTPLAYCNIKAERQRAAERIACIETGGEWRSIWGGTCEFEK